MKIEKLQISGIGGIKELSLEFNSGFNAICGPNGIGKTTILKIIVDAFASSHKSIKRNSTYDIGRYHIKYVDKYGKEQEWNYEIKEFDPQKSDSFNHVNASTPYLMNFRENRNIEYISQDSIPKDQVKNQYVIAGQIENGVDIKNMKGWFDNRFVFEHTPGSLTDAQKANIELAKKCFSVLDSSIKFETVDSSSLDIKLSSNKGEIYFEYLSAGYKSCVYLILGLIKEIEYRFGESNIKAEDFDGVVLIDEIDLHLHPSWQAKLINAIKIIFPKAQFIVTTHSPSVLQVLTKEELIPLTQDQDGNVNVKELNLTQYGLQGWTIEEILRDVMEMPETTSKLFEDTKKAFDKAMDTDNRDEAKKYYELLKEMLHPDSVLRRLIDIQMAGME